MTWWELLGIGGLLLSLIVFGNIVARRQFSKRNKGAPPDDMYPLY
jgi:hypothetical protein